MQLRRFTHLLYQRALRTLVHEERGAAFVLFGLLMVSFFGVAALVHDAGMYFEMRRQTQNAADAAAHAAALSLPDLTEAEDKAIEFWDANLPSVGNPSMAISFPPGSQRARIDVTSSVNFIFGPVIGVDSASTAIVSEVSISALVADVVVAMDTSGSMCSDSHGLRLTCPAPPPAWEPFTGVQEATLNFPEYLLTNENDWLGMVSFSTTATQQMVLTQSYNPTFTTKVNALVPDGYTNTGYAIRRSADLLDDGRSLEQALKIIVLVTDGVPTRYKSGASFVTCSSGCSQARNYGRTEVDRAVGLGYRVYTIGLGDSVDDDYLEDLADRGGGIYVESPTPDELEDAFAAVGRHARVKFIQ
jgi:Flp pilus assembly protein TadG